MVTRHYANGKDESDGYLDLADDVRELPWFLEVVKKAKETLRALPEESRPSWVRLHPESLED
jgi:hypothetical protein